MINPQNLVLRADKGKKCPAYAVVNVWSTNCYRQVVMDLVDMHPLGF
ncbi:MAG: hypothetical protein WDA27_02805 [Actinomycetota bacterium]